MNHVYVFFSDAENLLVSKDVIKMTDIGQAERSIRVHHTQCMSRHAGESLQSFYLQLDDTCADCDCSKFLIGTRNLKYQLESYVYTSKVGQCSQNSNKKMSFNMVLLVHVLTMVSFLLCFDMWAKGAILPKMLSLRPLFPGARSQSNILFMCNIPYEIVFQK